MTVPTEMALTVPGVVGTGGAGGAAPASSTGVETDVLLSAALVSKSPAIVGLNVSVPAWLALTTTVTLADLPVAIVPREHPICVPVGQTPWDAVTETRVEPGGIGAFSSAPVSSFEFEVFVTVAVKVTLLPTRATGGPLAVTPMFGVGGGGGGGGGVLAGGVST